MPESKTEEPSPKTDDGDFLGYGTYADTLWARINRSLQKDADGKTKLGDDPLVVGIFGEWGAGKSKLLSLVQKRAEAQSLRDISERVLGATSGNPMTVTVPVYFQPWKYEHERHLHVPLAVHIADALKEAWKKLPTDIEKLRAGLKEAGELAAETEKKLEAAKGVWDKGLKWWGSVKSVVNSNVGGFVAGATDAVLVSTGVPPMASIARKKIIEGMASDDDEEEGDEDEGTEDDKPKAKPATKHAGAKTKDEKPEKLGFAYKDDGLGFYRLHKHLRALTRPKLDKKILDDAGIEVTKNIEFDLRINFVVFIDDLDRCLPEKAVETLELIKTIFNTESFAFVLALDEEVVERGIGHRYKDYALKDKKPEMPITGFEYLEKIVHLPFRLPALSRGQALHFMERYEQENLLKDARHPYFKESRATPVTTSGNASGDPMVGAEVQLGALVVSAFDQLVPRKMVRLMENFHVLSEILEAPNGRRASLGFGHTGSQLDFRLVFALMLVQMFQPDLYRTLRYSSESIETLVDAFRDGELAANMSDVDLLDWGVFRFSEIAPVSMQEAIAMVGKLPVESKLRFPAQSVRLPIAAQLLQHRARMRPGFDALRLFAAVQATENVHPLPRKVGTAYFRALADRSHEPTEEEVRESGDVQKALLAVGESMREISPAGKADGAVAAELIQIELKPQG